MDERGFTLIELIAAMMIVGVLAALALPAFLGQADEAHDADAKADVRNAVSQMSACFAEPQSYGPCPGPDHTLAPGVSLVTTADGTGYTASRVSESGTTFELDRGPSGVARTCTRPGEGSCSADGSW